MDGMMEGKDGCRCKKKSLWEGWDESNYLSSNEKCFFTNFFTKLLKTNIGYYIKKMNKHFLHTLIL